MSDGKPCVHRLVLSLWIPGVQIFWVIFLFFCPCLSHTRDTKERDLGLAATLAPQMGYLQNFVKDTDRELKQQKRRRQRKRHLKSVFALPQTLSRLFHLNKCWQMFSVFNSKGLYQSSRKEKGSCCLVFLSSKKREIRHFHVVVVQRRQRNVQKSVMHVQSCCFANPRAWSWRWGTPGT